MITLKLIQSEDVRYGAFDDLCVSVKFLGTPYNFIVDTGAHKTCISQKLFNNLIASKSLEESEAIYRTIQKRTYHGCGGVEESQKVNLKLNFFGKIIKAVTIGHFLDEWNKKRYTEVPHDGLLGQDVLTQFRQVILDYEVGTISFVE